MAFISFGGERYRIQFYVDNVLDKAFVESGEHTTWIYMNKDRSFRLSGSSSF